MVLLRLVLVTYIIQILTKGETLVYNAANTPPDIIQCLDPSSKCIINCIGVGICSYKEIHCHIKSRNSICNINFDGYHSGFYVSIYTHTSPIVFINATGDEALGQSEVQAHETVNTKLHICHFTKSNDICNNIFTGW